jgi:acyl-CoA synthetase (AMP-forming)/AMP-acid ligase II
VLPKFDMQQMLSCVRKYRVTVLTIVPPILVAMGKNLDLLRTFDLSSVRVVLSGGAPLAEETIDSLLKNYPHWAMRQIYGSTEAAAAITSTCPTDCWSGSSGCVITGTEVKIYNSSGIEVTGYDEQGELFVKSPSVIPGYLNNEEANKELNYEDANGRWLRTGDIGVFRKSAIGNEHLFIVDRIKEMIKVLVSDLHLDNTRLYVPADVPFPQGNQVVPAELEECLLKHPAVADCAVIGVPNEKAGEVPKAYIQRSTNVETSMSDAELKLALFDFVKDQKARYKSLEGGVVFIDAIPRSPAGKIMRRILRDQRENRMPRL